MNKYLMAIKELVDIAIDRGYAGDVFVFDLKPEVN